MPSSEPIENDLCGISRRWVLDPTLAGMLVRTEAWVERIFSAEGLRWPGLYIISGYRTAQQQAEINPDNPQSLHVRCPSLAVDLRVGDVPASVTPLDIWQIVGNAWRAQGGRWGGDFPKPDVNHFDLGYAVT